MFSTKWRYVAQGFVSGAVVTASVCYSVFRDVKPHSSDNQVPASLFPYGTPVDNRRLVHYTGHSLYYDAERKQPLWVSELLTKQSLSGNAHRRHSKFRRDDAIPEEMSSANSDFWKSGWSRGHMAPAGNYKHSQKAMDDTFLLTNIVPQDIDNNCGFWNRLEMHCRDLTKRFDNIHIVSGPLYQPNMKDAQQKRLVQYEVIGENMIPVPTHLYKIILGSKASDSQPYVAAFVVPNKPISREEDELKNYQVALSDVEKRTGFLFHPNLDRSKVNNLCQHSDGACKLQNWTQFEIYFASRKLETAKSVSGIENIMNELKDKGVTPSQELLLFKERKVRELNSQTQMTQPAGLLQRETT